MIRRATEGDVARIIAIAHCSARSEASQLIRHPALHQRDNDRESRDVRPYGIRRNPSCDGDAIPYPDGFPSGLYVSDSCLKAKAATRNPPKAPCVAPLVM